MRPPLHILSSVHPMDAQLPSTQTSLPKQSVSTLHGGEGGGDDVELGLHEASARNGRAQTGTSRRSMAAEPTSALDECRCRVFDTPGTTWSAREAHLSVRPGGGWTWGGAPCPTLARQWRPSCSAMSRTRGGGQRSKTTPARAPTATFIASTPFPERAVHDRGHRVHVGFADPGSPEQGGGRFFVSARR
jgi:hypothetical protein